MATEVLGDGWTARARRVSIRPIRFDDVVAFTELLDFDEVATVWRDPALVRDPSVLLEYLLLSADLNMAVTSRRSEQFIGLVQGYGLDGISRIGWMSAFL